MFLEILNFERETELRQLYKKKSTNGIEKGNESGGKEMDPKVEKYSYLKKKNPISYVSTSFSICNALAGASLIKLVEHVSLRVKIKVSENYGHLRDTLCALDTT